MWRGRGEPHRRKDLFGGVGEVRVWTLLDACDVPPFAIVLGCELDPSGRVGTHVQDQCAEVVIVTEGEGVALVDGERHELQPGAVVPLPLGDSLALENASPVAPLRYLIVKAVVEKPRLAEAARAEPSR